MNPHYAILSFWSGHAVERDQKLKIAKSATHRRDAGARRSVTGWIRRSIQKGFGPPPWPWWRRQWPLGLVVLLVAVGVLLVLDQHVKRGSALIGGALLVAALLRSLLPARDIGLLAIRSRAMDVLTTGALGMAIVILTVVVPPRR